MTTLFFLLLIIPFYSEIMDMFNPSRRIELFKKFKAHNDKSKELKEFNTMKGDNYLENFKIKDNLEKELKEMLKSLTGTILKYLLYMALVLLGMLMSSHWILFTLLFSLGFISSGFKKISKNMIYNNMITVIDAIISTTLLFYIIINHFHHLNLIPIDLHGFLKFVGI
jgi:hypothetical protein